MEQLLTPDCIFESSWEVCNKVGGIYTVLSTRAKTLQEAFEDKIFSLDRMYGWEKKILCLLRMKNCSRTGVNML